MNPFRVSANPDFQYSVKASLFTTSASASEMNKLLVHTSVIGTTRRDSRGSRWVFCKYLYPFNHSKAYKIGSSWIMEFIISTHKSNILTFFGSGRFQPNLQYQ